MYTIIYNIKFLTFTKHKNIIDVQNTAEPAQIKSVGLECASLNIINHFCTILN